MSKKNSQNGSILFYILIAVILFAALSYAVSTMMRGAGGSASKEQESLQADEVLGYAKTLREAIQVLRVTNNCDETKLSFERSPFDGSDTTYVNAAAPTDFSCHVFHPQGGGIGAQTGSDGQDWIFTGGFYVDDVGSSANELVAVLHIKRSVCEAVNNKLDVSNASLNTAIDDGANAGNVLPKYQGSFTGNGEILQPEYVGKLAGCYKSVGSSGQDYTFYQVLLAK